MSVPTAMEVNTEARRILAVSISKLYSARSQRGGLRLHRSLLISMIMRSARDMYHSTRESEPPAPEEPMDTGAADSEEPTPPEAQPEPQTAPSPSEGEESGCEISEDKENLSPSRRSRKRPGKASAAPDFLPSKRARLEPGEERYAAMGSCRAGAAESLAALSLNRVIPAF